MSFIRDLIWTYLEPNVRRPSRKFLNGVKSALAKSHIDDILEHVPALSSEADEVEREAIAATERLQVVLVYPSQERSRPGRPGVEDFLREELNQSLEERVQKPVERKRRESKSVRLERKPLGRELIGILASDSEVPIIVHRSVAESGCEYIRKALNSGFSEGDSKTVKLLDHRMEVVEYYTEWLYSGRIAVLPPPTAQKDVEKSLDAYESVLQATTAKYDLLFDLYRLGDSLRNLNFCDHVMDGVLEIMDLTSRSPLSFVARAWDQLEDKSPMRKLLVEIWVARAMSLFFDGCGGGPEFDEAPEDFWRRCQELLRLGMRTETGNWVPHLRARCRWHYHEDGEKC